MDITGTFENPKVRPDLEGIAKARVKQEIDKHKDEVKQKLEDKLRGILGGERDEPHCWSAVCSLDPGSLDAGSVAACSLWCHAHAATACESGKDPGAGVDRTASSTAGEDANPAMTAQKASATAGYRRVVRNGRELYCREDVVLGSKISRGEVCRTSAELENAQRNTDDFMRGVRSTAGESAPPTGPLGR